MKKSLSISFYPINRCLDPKKWEISRRRGIDDFRGLLRPGMHREISHLVVGLDDEHSAPWRHGLLAAAFPMVTVPGV